MDYQSFSGQRISALAELDISQFDLSDPDVCVIHIYKHQNKSRLEHPTLIPKEIALKLLELCKATGRTQPFPNHESLWKEITLFARQNYNLRLTSHYLRRRYHSTAQDTPIPPNHWDYWIGSKGTVGHNADNYTLTDLSKFKEEYKNYLAPRLALRDTDAIPNVHDNKDTLIASQQEQIATLTKAIERLTAKLTA